MNIQRFQFNMFGVNTYVVWDPTSAEAMIVDPGMIDMEEIKELVEFVNQKSLKVKYLVNTHLHLDHAFGNQAVADAFGVIPLAHRQDFHLGETLEQQALMFGLPKNLVNPAVRYEPLDADSKLTLGSEQIKVLEVPGHSPGGIALYFPQSGFVLTGDSLFQGSIGRTDLPGGNHEQLVSAVREQLLTLPADTKVYPGHGPATTIGHEAMSNPWL